MDTIWIVVIAIFLVRCMGVRIEIIALHLVTRCLSGLVVLYVCNLFLIEFGEKFVVKINEISLGISAVLGMPGVFFLYCFQWFLTII